MKCGALSESGLILPLPFSTLLAQRWPLVIRIMNATKLRRYLIFACILSIIAWVSTSFSLIALWYFKGGLGDKQSSWIWKMFIFDIIPAFTSGYLLVGLYIWNIIEKIKNTEAGNRQHPPTNDR